MTTRAYDTAGPGGVGSLTPPLTNYVNVYNMDGTNPVTVTWPVGMTVCNIAGSADYWVSAGTTAAVPIATATDGTAPALNVAQRKRFKNESFSIISATAQFISVEFWSNSTSE